MEGGLLTRLGVCLAAVLASAWLLTPTVLGPSVIGPIELAAEREKMDDPPPLETPLPWWVDWLPNTQVNLGLDLQGGLDLTLEVEVDEAVNSSVQRDIPALRAQATRTEVKLLDVRREKHQSALLVETGEGVTLESVSTLFQRYFSTYQYTSTVQVEGKDYLRFELLPEAADAIAKRSVQQALETIRNRVDETGVKEPAITLKGETSIDIQLPGETDIDSAVRTIGTTAQLAFILVDEERMRSAVRSNIKGALDEAKAAMSAEDYADDRELSQWLVDHGKLPPGTRLMWEYKKDASGPDNRIFTEDYSPYILKDEIMLSGEDVNDAQNRTNGQTGEYYVQLEFKPRGQSIFAEVTGANIGNRFAIVLDDKVRSAPVIRSRIDGVASIEMGSTQNLDAQSKEASELALVLRSGALPAPVSVGEVRKVGASLGEQAIQEGLVAAIIGAGLVFAFAALYYRISGIIADITLVINALLVLALLAAFGATLTLPGICGIALTIGMAVDCNIIIYERIREEIRAGKGVRAALDAGFDRAFVAVFDSNITTLLAGVVLYSYGTGPLKGFAVTLMIGIFTTLFTGVFVSRTLMQLAFGRPGVARLSI